MAVYFIWTLILLGNGALTAFGYLDWFEGLLYSALGILLTLPFQFSVPARWGMTILNTATGTLHSVGPGRHFYALPIERLDKPGALRVFSFSFTVNAEAKNKDVTPLRVHCECETVPELLHRWFIVGEEEGVRLLVEERAKARLTDKVFNAPNREEVYEYIDILGEKLHEFLKGVKVDNLYFPAYCGVKVNDLRISDVELPQAIVDAETEKEVAEEKKKAKAIDWESVEERAAHMIKQGVDPENARKMVQVQDGKREAKIHEIEFGKNIAGLAKDISTGIGSLIKPASAAVTTPVAPPVAPKPPAQPRAPRVKPPFRAVVEVNDPKLAQEIVSGNKKVELEVKDGER